MATEPNGQANGAEAASQLRITPINQDFAARVDGIDLREPLDAAQVHEIAAAMDRYAVLVFPGQLMDDDQQLEFGSHFGPVEDTPTLVDQERRRLQTARVNDISNLGADGRILAADDRRRMFNLGNRLWHSDSSFKETPAQYSMLHARVIPPEGGETEFADMRAAWDALTPKMQAQVRDLICEHSLIFSRAMLGFDEFTEAERIRCTPVPQRLVRRHAGSGRLSLYLSAHAGRIRGWQPPEALMLLRDLTEFATQKRFVYTHRWAVNDLVVWDNRCTMHRGLAYDDKTYPRDMRRVTLMDTASTLEQAA
ncbi:alpha-ketoglutarate-dependent 2,4-dichlorophenoxyacetate dioxygenase [Roseomonas rosea]|uniref:Alpha-ketoglutarate-dependent 2,4-dichlorophenoxyacetate dioxygenase n=1 Tax=Muricoccus roseus TaxID=198092 RepID=A0A1M6HF01_9PROT|nr:TauD/TfdA family dioxygenase [Roseomonas rosea]SHJ20757.1 alpha-ketoglutarate-dependent 2,4-dichlorophenoxyacetate dioxygenase [Roseomonas rosea]